MSPDEQNKNSSSMFHILTDEEKAVAEAWITNLGEALSDIVAKGVLEALRQHEVETAVQLVQGDCQIKIDELVSASNGILSKPTEDEHLALVGEFDADKWAKLYIRTAPPQDVDTMRGWFANAIMAGYDHKAKDYRLKHKRMGQCLDIQGTNGTWNVDPYMLGMFNGMEHMMAIMEDRDPQFRSLPSTNENAAQTVQDVARNASEANVWAQTYATAFGNWWDQKDCEKARINAQVEADLAVKAFRERYK